MKIVNPRSSLYFVLHIAILVLGIVLAVLGNTLVQAIGASLAAAGVTGMVVYVYVARVERAERALEILNEFGFRQIFEARSVRIKDEYDSRCAKMKRNLDVMGFGLSSFLQDHREDLENWKGRVNVRILVIDPEYPVPEYSYADQRDLEEHTDKGRIRQDVENLRNELRPLVGEAGGKSFQVKLYRALPSINIFRVDNELLWGPYFMNQTSRNTPTFLVGPGFLFDEIMKHFEAIWDDPARSIPLT